MCKTLKGEFVSNGVSTTKEQKKYIYKKPAILISSSAGDDNVTEDDLKGYKDITKSILGLPDDFDLPTYVPDSVEDVHIPDEKPEEILLPENREEKIQECAERVMEILHVNHKEDDHE